MKLTVTTSSNIENITGSAYGDQITGNNLDNLFGYHGDDILNGMDGTDIFFGGLGADQIDGGLGGNDIAYYTSSAVAVTINLTTNVNIGGEAEGDRIVGVERIYGSSFNDSITGDTASNTLYGHDGTDTLSGGVGNDYLYGGTGVDTFVFGQNSFGKDTINDYEDGIDRLYFTSNVADAINDFVITGSGTSTVVLALANDQAQTITLKALTTINITSADFDFV